MLGRLGKKTRLLPKLLPLFPENITSFIDMFMGSGAVTFAMVDRCKYIIANDNDKEIFNLFMVLKEHKEELEKALTQTPEHSLVFKYWKAKKEKDKIWSAVRFLMLSNFGYLGRPDSMSFVVYSNHRKMTLDGIEKIFPYLHNIKFMSADFRDVLSTLSFRSNRPNEKKFAFVYADPPYLETGNNYTESFTEDDTRDLFAILTSSGIRFALSEFHHPLVMSLAAEHSLHVTSLGERHNLKNKREEILITNYQPERRQGSLFPAMGPC